MLIATRTKMHWIKVGSHLIVFSIIGGTLAYDVLYIDNGTGMGYRSLLTYRGYAGKFKHLTFWCQVGDNSGLEWFNAWNICIRRGITCIIWIFTYGTF